MCFLRILTLAGGNARLLEGLRQTLEENPLSTNLTSKWMDVSESRFSVDVTGKWSKSSYKMALLLAMTGIPVNMSIGSIDTIGTNSVIESLNFTDLEKDGLFQRRKLPHVSYYVEVVQPGQFERLDQYVLQISPLVAYMILDKLKSMISIFFFF